MSGASNSCFNFDDSVLKWRMGIVSGMEVVEVGGILNILVYYLMFYIGIKFGV